MQVKKSVLWCIRSLAEGGAGHIGKWSPEMTLRLALCMHPMIEHGEDRRFFSFLDRSIQDCLG